MQLLLMRHGAAESVDHFTGKDAARTLTETGRCRSQRAAVGLTKLESSIDLIASSPLVRAVQTAECVQQSFNAPLEIWPELERAGLQSICIRLRNLQSARGDCSVLLVGHEPSLGHLATNLLCNGPRPTAFIFNKCTVCCLDVRLHEEQEVAELKYFVAGKILRVLARS